MIKAKLKTRMITMFWAFVIMSIGGFVLQQRSLLAGFVMIGIGLFLFIGGAKGSTSFGFGEADDDWEDIDNEEILRRLRSMTLKKRRNEISGIMFMQQFQGHDDANNEETAKFNQGLKEMIMEDLNSLTEKEKKQYMKRITPDSKSVQVMGSLMENFSNKPKRDPNRNG